jgi:cyclic pyranopterin phosphate synthase
MAELTHVDGQGRSRMVDVSGKPVTRREARASGRVTMAPATVAAIREHRTPKGDPVETARLAGIGAAKRTAGLVPLCHPLALDHVAVEIELTDGGAEIASSVVVTGRTGAEMEALTAVMGAALTLYDMCKAVDRGMVIEAVRLEAKRGGRSGDWQRELSPD